LTPTLKALIRNLIFQIQPETGAKIEFEINDSSHFIDFSRMKLKSLSSLSLNLTKLLFTNRDIENLSSTMKRLKSLSSLALHFNGCKGMNDKTFRIISLTLKEMKSLLHLSLSFDKCEKISTVNLVD
jgi:hypothetical protein